MSTSHELAELDDTSCQYTRHFDHGYQIDRTSEKTASSHNILLWKQLFSTMVSEEHRTGLYITVPLYFVFLTSAAYWAYRRMEKMKHDEVSDQLSSHYLGGRDFGPLLTAGTLFASLFSGYTVVGVPNEAYTRGFSATAWMPNLLGVAIGYFGTGLRLLRTSMIRNHQSPADFITDRYQSQMLRYLIVFLQVVPTLIYLAAQVVAIQNTFNSIFELDPDSSYPVIIIMALILVFEWVGGLSSVALTDCIQAIVMVLSFIVVPIIIAKNYGGWSDLDPETYPKPEYFQTLSKEQQWTFWQFSLVNISFFTLPHLLQRTYAAKDPVSLQMGYAVMTIGPWLATFVGIFIGTVGLVILADEDGNPTSPSSPFTSILENMMDLGTFPKMAGVIAVTASLAAIMSTADSLIIAISQLVTVEIVHPLRPQTTSKEIGFIGKFVSLIAAVIAILVGMLWDDGLSDLAAIQYAISTQAVPPFLWGLFSTSKATDVHPWCLFAGTFLSSVYVVILYFGYLKPDNDSRPLHAGITGITINIVLSIILEVLRRIAGGVGSSDDSVHMMMKGDEQVYVIYPGRPEWDIPSQARFGGSCLTAEKVWHGMEGITEPMASPWWCFLMFFVLSIVCPWSSGSEPPLAPEGGDSKFLYPPQIVNGLPWWVFKCIMLSIIPTLLMLYGVYYMPKDFPEYGGKEVDDDDDSAAEDVVDKSGEDTDGGKKAISYGQPGSFSDGEEIET